MNRSPDNQSAERILRASPAMAGRFLGTDTRPLSQILAADRAALESLGLTPERLAERMQGLTDRARAALGTEVVID
ncbi:MAG: hypothetical protein KBE04_10545, partial [Phycisphaerae bacterium]|nr:hypothetical protein [Phycisphaerae bacterium]